MIRFAQVQEKLDPVFWLVSGMAGGSPMRRLFRFASHLSFSFEIIGSFLSYNIETSQWCDLQLTPLKKKIFFWPSDCGVIFLAGSISDTLL